MAMTDKQNLMGQVLVAQPQNTDGHFAKSVILVAQHGAQGAWGVVVNKRSITVNMAAIMTAAGIDSDLDEPVYIGGPVESNRVQVVHTLDWFSTSTLRINDELGITGDRSILAAIAGGEGPRLWRAGIGLAVWSAGQLDGEMSGEAPWTPKHQWLTAPASADICLNETGESQWAFAIDQCVTTRISELF